MAKPQQERKRVQDVVEKAALEKQAQFLKSPRPTCVCLVVHVLMHCTTSVGWYLYTDASGCWKGHEAVVTKLS